MITIKASQLETLMNTPPCRTLFSAGSGRCSVGKFLDLCLGEGTSARASHVNDGFIVIPSDVNNFLSSLSLALGKSWTRYADINDSYDGSLQDNHRKALRALFQDALAAGFIELEDDVAKEFYYTLQGTTLNEMA